MRIAPRNDRSPDPTASDADPAQLLGRLAAVEEAVARLASALDGHAAWLGDLQRGAADVVRALPQVSEGLEGLAADVHSLRGEQAGNVEWLNQLERWVRSCVRSLSELGGEPAEAASSLASHGVVSALQRRLEIWTTMQWLEHAAEVTDGPLVTVVTATVDRPELRRAVESVLAQSYGNLELVVVDDSTHGGAAARLSGIDDPRMRIVRSREGATRAMPYNVGLDAARGDILSALDDDCVMHPNWLRSVVWAFTRLPNVEALYGARVIEDPGAKDGVASGASPIVEFSHYDRRRHERANFVDRNTIAFRAGHRTVRYSETLPAAIDWDHSLRLFAQAPPMALPVIASFYGTVVADRIGDRPEVGEAVRTVRSRAHTTRPLRVHVHDEMYPVISETYITEDIRALQRAGAVVTVSAQIEAASKDADAPPCRLDYDEAIADAEPDVVLMHWTTHAEQALATMERHGTPFACRVHSFDFDAARVQKLLDHPLCVAVFAHPHDLRRLPPGVQPIIPVVGPDTVIPPSPAHRDLVLSASAGLPKKDFPLLLDAMSRLPEHNRMIIVARTNGVLTLPEEVTALAAAADPRIEVRVNVPRHDTLAAMARASVLLYTLRADEVPGFPMSIVEAMLCGTIVIAPDRPEVHEIVGEHLRPYRTADDIVGHVRDVAAGGPAVEAAREALRLRARRHREPATVQYLHDALRDGLTEWKWRQG